MLYQDEPHLRSRTEAVRDFLSRTAKTIPEESRKEAPSPRIDKKIDKKRKRPQRELRPF
jgi:hypothetical protein